MKIAIIYITAIIIITSVCILLFSYKRIDSKDNDTWVAPSSASAVANPLKGNQAATDEGMKTYIAMCVVCHGDKGKGDGASGVSLTPRPVDFIESSVMNETDGALYWKLSTGKAPMASYQSNLSDEQRWQLINYIRKLEANSK